MTPPPPPPQSFAESAAEPAAEARRPGLLGSVVEAGAVLAGGARLLWRHWPVLIALFLAGEVLRQLVMRAAVKVSIFNAELGLLVLLLAPMATLTTLVLMLRVVRPSLPWLGSGRGGKPLPVLVHLGSVLVPFMTIYYFEDDLQEDINDHAYGVWEDYFNQIFINLGEAVENGTDLVEPPSTADRLPFDLSWSLAAVVVSAIVLRWLLGRWSLTERYGWLGVPGAYLELIWFTVVTILAFNLVTIELAEWARGIRIGSAIVAIWEHGVGTAAGASSPPEQAAGWLLGQVGQIDTVLVIPLSWLAIGAVVIGVQAPGPARRPRVYQKAQQWWLAAPRALRWAGEQITGDLRERFTPLVRGVRMLVRAGAVPLLLFCLAFVVARRLPDWLWQLERWLIGPQEMVSVWLPLGWPLGRFNDAIGTAVLICLLAAAVDHALQYSQPAPDPAASAGAAGAEPGNPPAPPAPPTPPAGNGQPANGYQPHQHWHAPIPPPPGPVAPPLPPPPPIPAPQPSSNRT
ncbi:MAG TPA: hypothetical protein VIL37_05325 [Natronosporangium sp.]